MPSLKIFCIEFDRPDSIYIPGEIVSGNVIIDLASEKIVGALKLSAKGKATVNWSETTDSTDSDGKSQSDTTYYNKTEEYFNLTIPLLETTKDDGKVHIPVGLNKYSFHIPLPCNIPCSFEHFNGHVRYTVKAVIDRPWRFNHECKAAFTVITAFDLNLRQQQCIGICDELNKNFSSLCCFDDGSINVHIKLPTTGFVPGQWIETILESENSSNLKKISIKLIQSIDLHARTATKRCYSTVALIESTEPFAKHDVITLRLYIPPIPPSELEFCSIIHLNYILQMTFHISGMHCNSTKKYPVLIGTIPLRPAPSAPEISPSPHEPQFLSKNKIMPMPAEPDIASITSCPNSPPTNDSFNTVPLYEECCTNKAHNIKDQDESNYVRGADEPFAPRYPVFKFLTPIQCPAEKY